MGSGEGWGGWCGRRGEAGCGVVVCVFFVTRGYDCACHKVWNADMICREDWGGVRA